MEIPNCFKIGCTDKAKYDCRCLGYDIFICPIHTIDHMESSQLNHKIEKIFINISEDLKHTVINFLNKERDDMKYTKSKLIKNYLSKNPTSHNLAERDMVNLENDIQIISKLLDEIHSVKEVYKFEKDPVLQTLLLNSHEAIEKLSTLLPRKIEIPNLDYDFNENIENYIKEVIDSKVEDFFKSQFGKKIAKKIVDYNQKYLSEVDRRVNYLEKSNEELKKKVDTEILDTLERFQLIVLENKVCAEKIGSDLKDVIKEIDEMRYSISVQLEIINRQEFSYKEIEQKLNNNIKVDFESLNDKCDFIAKLLSIINIEKAEGRRLKTKLQEVANLEKNLLTKIEEAPILITTYDDSFISIENFEKLESSVNKLKIEFENSFNIYNTNQNIKLVYNSSNKLRDLHQKYQNKYIQFRKNFDQAVNLLVLFQQYDQEIINKSHYLVNRKEFNQLPTHFDSEESQETEISYKIKLIKDKKSLMASCYRFLGRSYKDLDLIKHKQYLKKWILIIESDNMTDFSMLRSSYYSLGKYYYDQDHETKGRIYALKYVSSARTKEINDKKFLKVQEALHKSSIDKNPTQGISDFLTSPIDKAIQYNNTNIIGAFTNPSSNLLTVIYKGKILRTNQDVAIKIYSHKNIDEVLKLRKEAEILQKLSGKHQVFLEFYGAFYKKKEEYHTFNIVMEYCPLTLYNEIARKISSKESFPSNELARDFYALIEGFSVLRQWKICHLDIKPSNIFISEEGVLKIGDFSVSQELDLTLGSEIDTGYHNIQGTKNFFAPELKIGSESKAVNKELLIQYSREKSDVYSLGLIFLYMVTLKSIKGYNSEQKQEKLRKIISKISENGIKTLLNEMLKYNYKQRPRFKDLLEMLNQDQDFQKDLY